MASGGPYGSARDLPSVQEIERLLAGFRLLRLVLPKEQRQELAMVEREHRRITDRVDSFYALLGSRNWVWADDLNITSMEHVIDTDDPAIAEARLIAYYKDDDRIGFSLRRLYRFEDMRPRIDLLDKALADYQAERYYSTVLVLLAVMDGFVNDLDKGARRGLHARPADEMVAWDSVVGHHLGLSHALKAFRKGFSKTDDSEVTEPYRNGIMHGMLVNFDNDVVATKAWNWLFAVADCAESWKRKHAEENAPASPSFRETFQRWMRTQRQKKVLEQWQPSDYAPAGTPDEQSEVERACIDFLQRWDRGQWGPLGEYFIPTTKMSPKKLAVQAKELYKDHGLSSWTINHIRHESPAEAIIDVKLVVDGVTYETELRCVHVDDDGQAAPDLEPGRWTLSPYGPSRFLRPSGSEAN